MHEMPKPDEWGGEWGLGPFRKYEGNPILRPEGGQEWESLTIFNPSAIATPDGVLLFYRAEGPDPQTARARVSVIGRALSCDGRNFAREPQPVLRPSLPEDAQGCEDPRVALIGGRLHLTYTGYDGQVARLCLAQSDDLGRTWRKLGTAFPDAAWDEFFASNEENRRRWPAQPRGWSKSGAIVPQRIDGRYWMYFGDTHIWVAHSSDLRAWQVVPTPVLSPRQECFDAFLVEPGPVPVMLQEGIWLGYNGARHEEYRKQRSLRYAFGQVMFALDDPARVVRRSSHPLLSVEDENERQGYVSDVVFAQGLAQWPNPQTGSHEWLLYYGMADTRLGLAIAPLRQP